MTKETELAWKEFEKLLRTDLHKKSCNYWEKYRNNKAIRKAYKLINKGIDCLREFEKADEEG